jgi:hypothetical protein
MKKLLGLTIIAVTLASCGPSGPNFAERRCTSYGYKPDTDSYTDCIAEEFRAERQASEATRNAIIFGNKY